MASHDLGLISNSMVAVRVAVLGEARWSQLEVVVCPSLLSLSSRSVGIISKLLATGIPTTHLDKNILGRAVSLEVLEKS